MQFIPSLVKKKNKSEENKKMKGNKIMGIIWLIIALILVFFLITGIKEKNGKRRIGVDSLEISGNNSAGLYETKKFAAAEIKSIDIDVSSESILFEKADDSEITVDLYCNESCVPEVSVENGTLKITSNNKPFVICFNRKIIVKIPGDYYSDDVDVHSASGSIRINNCNFGNVDANSSSGSIHLENCKFNNFDGKSASGSIKIENCEIPVLDCESTSGSVKAEGSFDSVDLKAVSGSISADLKKTLTGKSEMRSTSGSIHLITPENSNLQIKYATTSGTYKNSKNGTSGKKGTDSIGTAEIPLELKTTSGSIHIE